MESLKFHPQRDNVYLEPWEAKMEVSAIQYFSGRKYPKVHDVLDIGTGRGYFIEACLEAGLKPYGIDIRDIYECDRSRFILADVRKLPFKDRSFDLIFDSLFFDDILNFQKLEHNEVEHIVKEMYRVLRPNGIIYSTDGGCSLLTLHGFEILIGDVVKIFYYKK